MGAGREGHKPKVPPNGRTYEIKDHVVQQPTEVYLAVFLGSGSKCGRCMSQLGNVTSFKEEKSAPCLDFGTASSADNRKSKQSDKTLHNRRTRPHS
jgi:hypothetical protein